MSRGMDLVPNVSLDTAIAVTKRLQRDAYATLIDVETVADATTVRLSIPVSGMPGIRRMRRELWISFIERNVRSREQLTSSVDVRITRQREGVDRVAALTRHNRERLELHRVAAVASR